MWNEEPFFVKTQQFVPVGDGKCASSESSSS